MAVSLDIEEIKRILPHRYPFLLIDRVVSLETLENIGNIENGKIIGIKNVSANEPFFQGHFPNRFVMPGVLQLEAIAQLAAIYAIKVKEIINPIIYFLSIEKAKFRQVVVPGDQLFIEAKLKIQSETRVSGKGIIYVEEKPVSEVEMKAIIKKS